MENTLYDKIYSSVFKKQTLVSMLSNLEDLKDKIKGDKKISKTKLAEIVQKEITNPQLKKMIASDIKAGNLDHYTESAIASLISKVQDMTNVCKVIDLSLAIPLTEPDLEEIGRIIESKLKQKVIINIKVDPTLIGGVILKEDNYIVDASLKNHLRTYENEWIKSLRKARKSEESEE